MPKSRKSLITIDCETDPFLEGRVPEPFIWGCYNGSDFKAYANAEDLIADHYNVNCYMFAHNGGKFDFMYLLPLFEETTVLLINGRIVSAKIGKITLRDSYSIIPTSLASYKKDDFDYSKLERKVRHKFSDEIFAYLKNDCVYLHELVSTYFEKAGNRPTIASNAMGYARKLGIDVGRTSNKFDSIFRDFYFGGRVQAFDCAKFSNINIYDIKSAYPFAMSQSLPTGDVFIVGRELDHMTEAEIAECFIVLSCYSKGAFPVIEEYSLNFPHRLGTYFITGHEYLVAKKHALIQGEQIKQVFQFEESITFKSYVDHWFANKETADENGDAAMRLISKIMLNSLYGKLAQNPLKYYRYKIYPAGTPVDYENGWTLNAGFDDKELHARPMTWEFENKYGVDWRWHRIHYNVATAASITGKARAMLLDAMATVGFDNVVYCDTDCVFLKDTAQDHLLPQTGELGSWVWEGLADPCYVAGKKLYAAKMVNGPKIGKIKQASKGARLKFSDYAKLIKGQTVVWANDAPTFSLGKAPSFMVRRIRATAQRR